MDPGSGSEQPERATGPAARTDPEEVRLAHVLAGQEHGDHYLTPLADPAGKSVLVVGSGAGTDVLWCLRHGAREVVGIDVLAPSRDALDAAARAHGVDASAVRLEQVAIEEAPARLGRRFDLVLSNNVFEHVGDLAAAFAACAALVEPGSGRVAVFSSPLYWSSAGSHLPHAPWEHLWAEPEDLRRRLLAEGRLRPGHPLEVLPLADYLGREIGLNRARLADFVAAVAATDLVLLHLAVLPDRHAADLGRRLEAVRAAARRTAAPPAALDFALAGVALELALPAGGAAAGPLLPTAEARLAAERRSHGLEVERRRAAEAEAERQLGEAERQRQETKRLREEADALRRVLAAVEESWSFRMGRLLTAPARALRRLLGGGRAGGRDGR